MGGEAFAGGVRGVGDFDGRGADAQALASGQVFGAEIHVDEKIIPGQRPAFPREVEVDGKMFELPLATIESARLVPTL